MDLGCGFRRAIDEETLIEVAEMTGVLYNSAENASELENVFRNLQTSTILTRETAKNLPIFVGAAAVLITLALMLSLLWHPLQ